VEQKFEVTWEATLRDVTYTGDYNVRAETPQQAAKLVRLAINRSVLPDAMVKIKAVRQLTF